MCVDFVKLVASVNSNSAINAVTKGCKQKNINEVIILTGRLDSSSQPTPLEVLPRRYDDFCFHHFYCPVARKRRRRYTVSHCSYLCFRVFRLSFASDFFNLLLASLLGFAKQE